MLSNVSLLLSLFEQKTSQTTNSLKENEKIGKHLHYQGNVEFKKMLELFFFTAYKKVKQAD